MLLMLFMSSYQYYACSIRLEDSPDERVFEIDGIREGRCVQSFMRERAHGMAIYTMPIGIGN